MIPAVVIIVIFVIAIPIVTGVSIYNRNRRIDRERHGRFQREKRELNERFKTDEKNVRKRLEEEMISFQESLRSTETENS